MKHTITLLTIVLLSFFTACGGPGPAEPPPTPVQDQPTVESEPAPVVEANQTSEVTPPTPTATRVVQAEVAPQGEAENPAAPQDGPDLVAAAQVLGISEQQLREAMGPPPPDLTKAAAALGVSEEALHQALGLEVSPPPTEEIAVQPESTPTTVATPTSTPVQTEDGDNAQTSSETTSAAGTTTSPVPTGICPTAYFAGLTPDARNSERGYAAPQVNVTCTGTEILINTNNIPNFEFVQVNPGNLTAQDLTFTIPLNPSKAETMTDIPLGWASAVAANGLLIFGPTESPADGYRDPYLDQILDFCNGHLDPQGAYHLHAPPTCIYPQEIGERYGFVVGYAFDGYPILASYLCDDAACTTVTELTSSWQETNPGVENAWEQHSYVAGSGTLDECNGLEFADGSYAYFATEKFPYFMGCYRGVVTNSNFRQAQSGGNQQGGTQKGGNQQGDGPDFAAAAAQLGIREDALREALGPPPPDFAAAAAQLGVSEEALRQAIGGP